jgi:anti-sigma regulatory factor (Ser/Thr protein kinase)
MEYRGMKIIYRRYASLFFICGVDSADEENELGVLEFIHALVETLDKYFENVCELDIMFNLEKAHFILEEMVTNVFKYGGIPAGSDACMIEVLLRGTFMDITIEDTGKPFNPLLLPEVDTAKNIEDRPIGGLGIHFVKKLTDSQYYEHRDGKNVLKLTKGLRS